MTQEIDASLLLMINESVEASDNLPDVTRILFPQGAHAASFVDFTAASWLPSPVTYDASAKSILKFTSDEKDQLTVNSTPTSDKDKYSLTYKSGDSLKTFSGSYTGSKNVFSWFDTNNAPTSWMQTTSFSYKDKSQGITATASVIEAGSATLNLDKAVTGLNVNKIMTQNYARDGITLAAKTSFQQVAKVDYNPWRGTVATTITYNNYKYSDAPNGFSLSFSGNAVLSVDLEHTETTSNIATLKNILAIDAEYGVKVTAKSATIHYDSTGGSNFTGPVHPNLGLGTQDDYQTVRDDFFSKSIVDETTGDLTKSLAYKIVDNSDNIITGIAKDHGVALIGAGGNDTLIGTSFADGVWGGIGKDTMTGGKQADTFIFNNISDFNGGTNKAWMDIITDFKRSDGDKIDLTGTGLAWDAAGTKLQGTVWFDRGVLWANTNTESGADIGVVLKGVTSFAATDLGNAFSY